MFCRVVDVSVVEWLRGRMVFRPVVLESEAVPYALVRAQERMRLTMDGESGEVSFIDIKQALCWQSVAETGKCCCVARMWRSGCDVLEKAAQGALGVDDERRWSGVPCHLLILEA